MIMNLHKSQDCRGFFLSRRSVCIKIKPFADERKMYLQWNDTLVGLCLFVIVTARAHFFLK